MTINESTQKQSLLEEFNQVVALYAILKTNSSSLRVKQAVYRQGEVPAEPLDFLFDVEIKTKRAIGQQFYDLFLRAVYNENLEILPEYLREALGKAYLEYRLGVEGVYRKLYFDAKQGQMREALRARGEHD
jgi:DNA phosphorothioation-dependent restriction protein DptG